MELGTWSLELGAWSLELGTWSLELGAWNLEPATWNLELGACNLELGAWGLELGAYSLGLGAWNLELGAWNQELRTSLELGAWNLELGSRSLELGFRTVGYPLRRTRRSPEASAADPAKKATRLFDAAIGQTEVLETFEKMLVPILGPTLDANVGDRERTPTVGGPFKVYGFSGEKRGPKILAVRCFFLFFFVFVSFCFAFAQ